MARAWLYLYTKEWTGPTRFLPTDPYFLPTYKLFYNLLHTFYAMESAGPCLLCTEELTANGRFLPMNPYLQPT
jgi:hypothetical protein